MEFRNKVLLHSIKELKYGLRLVRREGGRFLVLFKGSKNRVSPRFYFFVSDVNQGNEGTV